MKQSWSAAEAAAVEISDKRTFLTSSNASFFTDPINFPKNPWDCYSYGIFMADYNLSIC